MPSENYFVETRKYRCLVENTPPPSQALYLKMCGLEYCTPNKAWGPGRRSGYHLHMVLAGEGSVEVGGRCERLHAGQLFLEKPGEMIRYYPNRTNPWTYCWVTFDGDNAADYMEKAGFVAGINTLNSYVDAQEFYRIADAMLDHPTLQLSSGLRRFGLLNEFIALVIESNCRSRQKHRTTAHAADNYIDHALDFIHRNYSSITVADISTYIGVNRSYFASLFKQRLQVSPCEYLLHVRMEKSAQLLVNTALPIQDVAVYVGYENPLTFSKAFKKSYGVSPKFYRSQPDGQRAVLPPLPTADRNGVP